MYIQPDLSGPESSEGANNRVEPRTSRSVVLRMIHSYAAMISRHPVVAMAVFLVNGTVLAESIRDGRFPHGIAYLVAAGCGVLLVDLAASRRGVPPRPLPVRRPSLELTVALACLLIVGAWLFSHFENWNFSSRIAQIAWDVLGALNLWHVPLLLFFLLAMRYRWKDIGFRLVGLESALLVMSCFAVLAWASHAGTTLVGLIREEGGILKALQSAFFAAFTEEFFRLTWQTRLGAVLNNRAASWLITAVLWSLLHFPGYRSLHYCLEIVPLGLLWGYVMFRTRSLLPTFVLHFTNIWGLQNGL